MCELEIMKVIHTRLLRRGEGCDSSDPMRIIDQYWLEDGSLLFEYDVHTKKAHSSVHEVRFDGD